MQKWFIYQNHELKVSITPSKILLNRSLSLACGKYLNLDSLRVVTACLSSILFALWNDRQWFGTESQADSSQLKSSWFIATSTFTIKQALIQRRLAIKSRVINERLSFTTERFDCYPLFCYPNIYSFFVVSMEHMVARVQEIWQGLWFSSLVFLAL